MKKKLLVLTSFIALVAATVGCGETFISYKASNSTSQSLLASSSTSKKIVYTNDSFSYYAPNYNDEKYQTRAFVRDLIDTDLVSEKTVDYHAANVTPDAILERSENIEIYYVEELDEYFVYYPNGPIIHPFSSGNNGVFQQIGLVDLYRDGHVDVVAWSINRQEKTYSLDYYDSMNRRMGRAAVLSYDDEQDYVFRLDQNYCYINNTQVEYFNGVIYCPGIFNDK